MTRDQLRERIDTMENLHDVITAIDDITDAEFFSGEKIDLQVSERSPERRPVAFVTALPVALMVAALRALKSDLERQLSQSEERSAA